RRPVAAGAAAPPERARGLAHRSGADREAGRHRRLLVGGARTVPQAGGAAASRAGRARVEGGDDVERAAGRGQEPHRGQHRPHAQRVLPAQGAAHRRRSAPADDPADLRDPAGRRPQRDPEVERRHPDDGDADHRTAVRAAGRTAGLGSDQRPDLAADAARAGARGAAVRLGAGGYAAAGAAAGRGAAHQLRGRRAAHRPLRQGAVFAGAPHGGRGDARTHPRGDHERGRPGARSERRRLLRLLRLRLRRHAGQEVGAMAKGLIQAAHWRLSTLIVSETALIAAAISLTAYARLAPEHWIFTAADIVPKALLATCVCQLCLYYSDLYDDPRAGGDNSALLIRTLQALGMTLLVLAFLYGMFPALTIGRGVIGPGVTFAAAALIAWRIAFGWVQRECGPRERLLMVGMSPSALPLARELRQREELGIEIVGYVDVTPQSSPSGLLPLLGTIEDVPAIVRARQVDRVVVSLADARGKLPMDKLLEMKLGGMRFD